MTCCERGRQGGNLLPLVYKRQVVPVGGDCKSYDLVHHFTAWKCWLGTHLGEYPTRSEGNPYRSSGVKVVSADQAPGLWSIGWGWQQAAQFYAISPSTRSKAD